MSRWRHGQHYSAYDSGSQSQPPPPEPAAPAAAATTSAATDEPSAALERPPELRPHGPSPPFHSFVFILEALRDAKGMDKKRDKLRRYFKMWRERVGLDLVSYLPLSRRRIRFEAILVDLYMSATVSDH
jgi:hypothetical protein